MSRLEFATQQEAQDCADSLHQRMVGQDSAYGTSAGSGKTTAWAIPYQDRDRDDNIIPTSPWYVNVKNRCDRVMTQQERTAVVEPAGDR